MSCSPTYSRLYLSPHLDDAVLSCGGQIHRATRRGERVLVVTVMAGDPPRAQLSDYAHRLHARWELEREATAARRTEDRAACALLGAEALHLDIPDCIYRSDPLTEAPLYTSDPDIFGPVHPADRALLAELIPRLATLPSAQEVLVPLTVGHHVDHVLVREAAEAVWGQRIWYYEDYPYAQEPGALEAALGDPKAWIPRTVPLREEDLQARIQAILAYRSQLSTFFTDRADLERQVRAYTARVGGERLWRRRDGVPATRPSPHGR